MSGSLTDILTTSKNVVTAVNQLGQTYLAVQGSKIYKNITAATLVQKGAGRIASVVVVVAGSTSGAIYDAISTAAAAASNQIWTIPPGATGTASGDRNTGMPVVLNLPVSDGIVVTPGTGMTVVVSYS